MNVRLQAVGALLPEAQAAPITEIPNQLRCKVMLVYSGSFESMDGTVNVADEDIHELSKNHNSFIQRLKRAAVSEIPMRMYPPMQVDHSPSALMTVGRLIGETLTGMAEIPLPRGSGEHPEQDDVGSEKRLALFGEVLVLGRENVEKVLDGRWTHVSIGMDLAKHTINELSFTPFPAAAHASLLGSKQTKEKTQMKFTARLKALFKLSEDKDADDKANKLKKHLMEHHKMSAEDADKKLSGMNDEECSKLASEVDEHEKKLAADKDAEEKKLAAEKAEKEEAEKKDKEAKLAAKTQFITLAKGIRTSGDTVRLAAKKEAILARLSSLRAHAKITPAEIKKIDVAKLAADSPEVIEATLKSYSDREPIVDTTIYGNVRAVELSKITEKYKTARLELEFRLAMPSKRKAAEAQLARLAEEEKKEVASLGEGTTIHVDATPHAHYEMAYGEVCKMLDEGRDKEAVKAAVKRMLDEGMKLTGEGAGTDEKRMSALDESVKALHTQFQELIKLAGPIVGIEPKELD